MGKKIKKFKELKEFNEPSGNIIVDEIIAILGRNHTTPAVFNNYQKLEAHAIYTYRGEIFCLKDGLDFPFEDLTQKRQSDILNELKAKEFRFDNSFQG